MMIFSDHSWLVLRNSASIFQTLIIAAFPFCAYFLSKWGWKTTVFKIYLVDDIHEPLLIFSRQVVASGYGRKPSTLPWCQVLWESSTLGQCHSCGSTSSAFLRGSRWKQIKKRNESKWMTHRCTQLHGKNWDTLWWDGSSYHEKQV